MNLEVKLTSLTFTTNSDFSVYGIKIACLRASLMLLIGVGILVGLALSSSIKETSLFDLS